MAKNKKPQFTTPRAIAVYPRLNTPDSKFHKEGVYKADIRLEGEAAQKLIDQIQDHAMEHVGEKLPVSDAIVKVKGKYRPNEDNPCFQPEFDKETGEMSGAWIFKFQAKNRMVKDRRTGESRLWDRKPIIYSSSGSVVKSAKIGAGTEMVVVYELYVGKNDSGEPFMNMQPIAVQIFKLVEYTAGSAPSASALGLSTDGDGWEPEEGGDGDEDNDTGDDGEDDSEEGEDDF